MKRLRDTLNSFVALTVVVVVFTSAFSARLSVAQTQTSTTMRSSCDADLEDDDRAVKLRDLGLAPKAEPILRASLSRHADNFRATFVLATVMIQQKKNYDAQVISTLNRAEQLLPNQSIGCIRLMGWYELYNVEGVYLFKHGNRALSKGYFDKAYMHFNDLFVNSKQNVTSNMGLYYFTMGDLPKAAIYYTLSAKLGNKRAANHLETTKKLLGT